MKAMLIRGVCCFVFLLLAVFAERAAAENWPQWRGPRRDGVSNERGIASEWSRTKNVAWRLPLPGPAGATPVVWNDRIFLTTTNGDRLELHCVSTTGKPLWQRVVCDGNRNVRGDEGNSASPTPSTDGEHVWTFMANGVLACYDVEGSEVWKFDVQDRFGKLDIAFGMTSTPVLDGERLYLQLIHGDGDPASREAVVVALDKRSGKTVWKHQRMSDGRDECEHAYCSPVLYRDEQRAFLLSHGADYTVAHSLDDGHEIWRCGGLNPKGNYDPTLRFVASPVAVPGLIVIPTAKRGPVVAVHPTGSGDITDSPELVRWAHPRTPDVPSPLVNDGLVYLCLENGNLIVLDAEDGEKIYEQRTVRDRHRASPVFADGKIYLTSRKGVVTVVAAGRKFKILAQNDLGEPVSSSPAIADGTLYVRTFNALYAIREAD